MVLLCGSHNVEMPRISCSLVEHMCTHTDVNLNVEFMQPATHTNHSTCCLDKCKPEKRAILGTTTTGVILNRFNDKVGGNIHPHYIAWHACTTGSLTYHSVCNEHTCLPTYHTVPHTTHTHVCIYIGIYIWIYITQYCIDSIYIYGDGQTDWLADRQTPTCMSWSLH